MRQLSRRDLLDAGLAATSLGSLPTLAQAATLPARPARSGEIHTGGARMIPISGNQHVWVKPVLSGHGGIPVLTLHGGPGFPHFYFECFEDFLPQAGISYWYYDQLGCGFSDQPKDSALWTIERFTTEVEEVRAALGFDRMVLLGHSWGGLLCLEYALKYPKRLAGMVVSNMTASTDSYLRYLAVLRKRLPPDTLRRLEELEAAGSYDSSEYEKIMFEELYPKYVCRINPWPEPVARAVRFLAEPVYNAIQGKSEFEVTGSMRGWDRWNDLHRIRAPTLLLGGEHDEINPDDMREMARRIPNAAVTICDQGSHLAMYDDQARYFAALIPFLKRVTGK